MSWYKTARFSLVSVHGKGLLQQLYLLSVHLFVDLLR
uniref:Uncharacterized protein n=1 Tax=Arundo donax TaxID=35708 RepID=A0A0A8ZTJ1_ARUDO